MEKDKDGFITGAPAAPEEKPKDPVPDSDLVANEFEVSVTLADQQADPNSPLFSVKSFEELGLQDNLLRGIFHMGFTKPSKIQERALPLLLANPPTNFVGQSQSGTGKTAAFVLTMLSRIDYSLNKPQAICLAPTRELARQIMSVITTMGQFTDVQTEYAIKDSLPDGATTIRAHIVVGTPGTMKALIDKRILDVSNVKVLVLDEADNMLKEDGFSAQITRVKNAVGSNKKPQQIVLFSATFPDKVRQFAYRFATHANKIELEKQEMNVDNIRQFYMDCKNESQKYEILSSLYHIIHVGQSIIFCQYRSAADKIAQRMTADNHQVASLHGAKDASERDSIIDSFRQGKQKVLITTNVVARGIDISQVNLVVNYDLPLMSERFDTGKQGRFADTSTIDVETYIHRIGRTGRFGKKGIAINFVHDQKTMAQIQELEQATGKTITKVETDNQDDMEDVFKKAMK